MVYMRARPICEGSAQNDVFRFCQSFGSYRKVTIHLKTQYNTLDATPWTVETVEPYMRNGMIAIDTKAIKSGTITFESSRFIFIIEHIVLDSRPPKLIFVNRDKAATFFPQ